MTIQATPPRTPSPVDAIADEHAAAMFRLSPMLTSACGVDGAHDQFDDLSPEGFAERANECRRALAQLADAVPTDGVDVVTLAAMRDRLDLTIQLNETRLDSTALNVIGSPLESVRSVFDLMPTATPQDWATIAARLEAVPEALRQLQRSFSEGADAGVVGARRQFEDAARMCTQSTSDKGYFTTLAATARLADGSELPASLQADLERGTATASAGFAEMAQFLTDMIPRAREREPLGAELYPLVSREFIGAEVDLAETYAWGQSEVARLKAEMKATASKILPGEAIPAITDALNADPRYRIEGTAALQRWMQEKSDAAVQALNGTHFDIPEPLRRLDARIAPSATGGIYYTGPSDDFSRPGAMWWSVPEGVTEFGTWSELTTVYHEGVPGHHLQIAFAVYLRETLNTWRRLQCWISGHGEGWALYAEGLMAELGFLDDPGNYFGLLDSQMMRATRVVLDIGIHCGFAAPREVGAGPWTYDKAWQYFSSHVNQNDAYLRSELHRYLAWPGQAPSYAVGNRLWHQLRADAAAQATAAGQEFSLVDFHRRALAVGSVPMDVLRDAVLA